ncbi:MAG TPA: serine/threonine-protein kinase [Phycisphaerales bacterium]|nr:serine/threonine-protein kinase [Phycisphaerales bacterium]
MGDQVPAFKQGDEVEGFRVLKEIGQGAASVIYLVHDPKTKQIWTLKHVHRGDAKDDRFLQQTIEEYQVASKLDHPNLRKVIKLTKKNKHFVQLTDVLLVMEYVDGLSMDLKPPKNFDDAIRIFQQTASALAHMHERGFVHADMKPNNILLTPGPNDSGPIVKVIDLGQSCKTGTIKPRIQGTPDYIAPEQVHRRPITPKTDIYNLGATMYWTLTARTIPTALAKGDSLVSRIDDALIPKPKPAIELNTRIPVKLNELIMQCVEVDPADRPANMSYVIERLELVLGMLRARNDGSGAQPNPGNAASASGMIFNAGSGVGLKVGDANGRP